MPILVLWYALQDKFSKIIGEILLRFDDHVCLVELAAHFAHARTFCEILVRSFGGDRVEVFHEPAEIAVTVFFKRKQEFRSVVAEAEQLAMCARCRLHHVKARGLSRMRMPS